MLEREIISNLTEEVKSDKVLISIPDSKDGLYQAVVLGLLFPVINNKKEFLQRLGVLIGGDDTVNQDKVYEALEKCRDVQDSKVFKDPHLKKVFQILRARVEDIAHPKQPIRQVISQLLQINLSIQVNDEKTIVVHGLDSPSVSLKEHQPKQINKLVEDCYRTTSKGAVSPSFWQPFPENGDEAIESSFPIKNTLG